MNCQAFGAAAGGYIHDLSEALANPEHGADEARKAVPYFTNHALRMDYAAYRQAGYQIGSGTVESACKQLGTQRMKVPGPPGTCKTHA